MAKSTLYVSFAIAATIVNILAQEIVSKLYYHPYEIVISIFSGTLAGLTVKYLLDKKFIFEFETNSQKQDLTTLTLYILMVVATTVLFWITEYTFDQWFETKTMRYVGAVIGLSIGYATKYYLDKRFVFVER